MPMISLSGFNNGRRSAASAFSDRRPAIERIVPPVVIGMRSIGIVREMSAIAPRVKMAIAPKISAAAPRMMAVPEPKGRCANGIAARIRAPKIAITIAATRCFSQRLAARSAIAGISGRMYCGRFDCDRLKKTKGTAIQSSKYR